MNKMIIITLAGIFIVSSPVIYTKNKKSSAQTSSVKMETIVILRHGEKPPQDLGQLNCMGLNRSLALPKVLSKKFGKPDYIFASNPAGKDKPPYYYVRPIIYIGPTAVKFQKPINTKYEFNNYEEIARTLIKPTYHNAVLYVAWEHIYAEKIAKKILQLMRANPNQIPKWSGNDFDSLYAIKIDWSKHPPLVNFTHEHQGLDNMLKLKCPK